MKHWSELEGNAARYAPENAGVRRESPLRGKHLIFLGSSVTLGARAGHTSFADHLAVRDGCTVTKEAVSGTTLTDDGEDSYVARLKRIPDPQADLFVCQLSTNDAAKGRPLGEPAEGFEEDGFDTATVAGAVESILAYAERTWRCPVVFFTCPRFESEGYAAMVPLLHRIAAKWGIAVIDLWNDEAFNALTAEQRALYMADEVHPTRAGHLEWWTPRMERDLEAIVPGTAGRGGEEG